MKNIGQNIQKLIQKRKISKKDFSYLLEMSEQTVDEILNGFKALNLLELKKISKILNVSVESLLPSASSEPLNKTPGNIKYVKNIIQELLFLDRITK